MHVWEKVDKEDCRLIVKGRQTSSDFTILGQLKDIYLN